MARKHKTADDSSFEMRRLAAQLYDMTGVQWDAKQVHRAFVDKYKDRSKDGKKRK